MIKAANISSYYYSMLAAFYFLQWDYDKLNCSTQCEMSPKSMKQQHAQKQKQNSRG